MQFPSKDVVDSPAASSQASTRVRTSSECSSESTESPQHDFVLGLMQKLDHLIVDTKDGYPLHGLRQRAGTEPGPMAVRRINTTGDRHTGGYNRKEAKEGPFSKFREHDEDSVEDVYLGRVMSVKNTFIHLDGPSSRALLRTRSAPDVLMEHVFHTKFPAMEQAHARKECRPCAYHVYKPDGCRWGDQCDFCHLCTRGEIKKRKKEKARASRTQSTAVEGAPFLTQKENTSSPRRQRSSPIAVPPFAVRA